MLAYWPLVLAVVAKWPQNPNSGSPKSHFAIKQVTLRWCVFIPFSIFVIQHSWMYWKTPHSQSTHTIIPPDWMAENNEIELIQSFYYNSIKIIKAQWRKSFCEPQEPLLKTIKMEPRNFRNTTKERIILIVSFHHITDRVNSTKIGSLNVSCQSCHQHHCPPTVKRAVFDVSPDPQTGSRTSVQKQNTAKTPSRGSTWAHTDLGLLKQTVIKAILLLPPVKRNPHSTIHPLLISSAALNYAENLT